MNKGKQKSSRVFAKFEEFYHILTTLLYGRAKVRVTQASCLLSGEHLARLLFSPKRNETARCLIDSENQQLGEDFAFAKEKRDSKMLSRQQARCLRYIFLQKP